MPVIRVSGLAVGFLGEFDIYDKIGDDITSIIFKLSLDTIGRRMDIGVIMIYCGKWQ